MSYKQAHQQSRLHYPARCFVTHTPAELPITIRRVPLQSSDTRLDDNSCVLQLIAVQYISPSIPYAWSYVAHDTLYLSFIASMHTLLSVGILSLVPHQVSCKVSFGFMACGPLQLACNVCYMMSFTESACLESN